MKNYRNLSAWRMAAWHRGVDLGSDEHFSSDGAELLHQNQIYFSISDKAPSHVRVQSPDHPSNQDALVEVKPLIDVGDRAFLPTQWKRSMRSRRGSAGIVTKTEDFDETIRKSNLSGRAPCCWVCAAAAIFASVDDAQSFALSGGRTICEARIQVREDYWGGDLALEKKGSAAAIVQRQRNWFLAGTESISTTLHVYDSDGKLAEDQTAGRRAFAAAHVIPKATAATSS